MRWKLVFVLVISVIILAIIGFYYLSNFSQVSSLRTPSPDSWPFYQGQGFTVRYPSGMQVRQTGNDLRIEKPNTGTLIFIDPFRYTLTPDQTFYTWYTQYLAQKQKDWQVSGTSIRDLQDPSSIGENKYQMSYFANEFGSEWLEHRLTFLVNGNQIIILTWRPLPKSMMDPYSYSQDPDSLTAYQSEFAWQSQAYDLIAESLTAESDTPKSNSYTSPVFQGQYFRIPLPAGWVANQFSEYVGNYPLNDALGVEFYQSGKKEWSWAEQNPQNRIQVKFVESGEYHGRLQDYDLVADNPRIQLVTNHYGVLLANLIDGRVLLNFPGDNICIFQLDSSATPQAQEDFNTIVTNLEILHQP